jgi:isopenicillin N synthase-like dioxygenase
VLTGENSNPHYVLGYSEEQLPEGTTRQGYLTAHDCSRMRGLWPDELLPGWKAETLQFMALLHQVVDKLMRCFALALDLPEEQFVSAMNPADDDNASALFHNFYPDLEDVAMPDDGFRIWAHTDFEVMTLLFQSRPGLEICPGKTATSAASVLSETWFDVDPLPGCITVNLGDALQYWTRGRLKSTYHRVRLPRPGESRCARQSLAYFANAGLHTNLQSVEGEPPVTFLDIIARRNADVPLVADPSTGAIGVASLAGKAGGPDFAAAVG